MVAGAQPRWLRKYSIQCCSVNAAIRYGWWQEREGIDAAHFPAAGAGCVLLELGEADTASERAACRGITWAGGVLLA